MRLILFLQFSMISAVTSAEFSYFAGVHLGSIVEELEVYRSVCKQYKQLSVVAQVEMHLQFCLNLMGKSRNAVVLTGDAMTEQDVMVATQATNPQYFAWLHVLKLTLAVYMNDLSVAQNMSCRLKHLAFNTMTRCHVAAFLFVDGMTAAMSSVSSQQEKKRAANLVVKLKRFAEHAPANYLHRLYLVEAEMATSAGRYDEAFVKYQQSIALAAQHKLIHEQALACERACYALQKWQRPMEAQEYLRRARSLYDEWGAKAKSDQLSVIVVSP